MTKTFRIALASATMVAGLALAGAKPAAAEVRFRGSIPLPHGRISIGIGHPSFRVGAFVPFGYHVYSRPGFGFGFLYRDRWIPVRRFSDQWVVGDSPDVAYGYDPGYAYDPGYVGFAPGYAYGPGYRFHGRDGFARRDWRARDGRRDFREDRRDFREDRRDFRGDRRAQSRGFDRDHGGRDGGRNRDRGRDRDRRAR